MKTTTEKIFTHPLGIMAAATGATLLWGSSFPFIKLSYAELGIGKEMFSSSFCLPGTGSCSQRF
jgi:hypothetical protein